MFDVKRPLVSEIGIEEVSNGFVLTVRRPMEPLQFVEGGDVDDLVNPRRHANEEEARGAALARGMMGGMGFAAPSAEERIVFMSLSAMTAWIERYFEEKKNAGKTVG